MGKAYGVASKVGLRIYVKAGTRSCKYNMQSHFIMVKCD